MRSARASAPVGEARSGPPSTLDHPRAEAQALARRARATSAACRSRAVEPHQRRAVALGDQVGAEFGEHRAVGAPQGTAAARRRVGQLAEPERAQRPHAVGPDREPGAERARARRRARRRSRHSPAWRSAIPAARPPIPAPTTAAVRVTPPNLHCASPRQTLGAQRPALVVAPAPADLQVALGEALADEAERCARGAFDASLPRLDVGLDPVQAQAPERLRRARGRRRRACSRGPRNPRSRRSRCTRPAEVRGRSGSGCTSRPAHRRSGAGSKSPRTRPSPGARASGRSRRP